MRLPTESSLWNRDFLLLLQGQIITQIGNQAFMIATMYLVMNLTGSSTLMGMIMMLQTAPLILLGPAAGTFADWYSRKRIMVVTDLVNGVGVLSLAILLAYQPNNTGLVVAWLAAVACMNGVNKAFFGPAMSASIPDLVPIPDVAKANSMTMFSAQSATFFGQAVGGVAYRVLGAPILYLIDGISYLLSALSESFIDMPANSDIEPGKDRRTSGTFVADTLAGLRYVFGKPGAKRLLVNSVGVNALVMPVLVLLPFHVDRVLGGSASVYGFLLAAFGVGSIAGYIAITAGQVRASRRVTIINASFILAPALMALLGAIESTGSALALMFGAGLFSGMINVYVLTIFQTTTASHMRGRVMSVVYTVAGAATPLGMIGGGIAGDFTGHNTPLIFMLSGGIAVLISAVNALSPEFRRFISSGTNQSE